MALRIISAPPSGNIVAISYDPDTQTLLVQFRYQDAVYRYTGIDENTADGFSQALSATDYLKSAILPLSPGERIA